jgi:antitoxin CptB
MMNADAHQADPLNRARLRWRSRRGLLENDIIITRFLDRHELELTDTDVEALTRLLELPDNELLDYLLARKELPATLLDEGTARVLGMLRAA